MPRDTRLLQEMLTAVEENDIDEIKFLLNGRLRRRDSRFSLTCVSDQDEKASKEYEIVVLGATKLKDVSILKYLISNGINVNFVNEPPNMTGSKIQVSPLHVAVNNGLPDSVSILLDANADANKADHNGRTPLHLAVKRACCESCRLLLAHGGSTYIADKRGVTPLQMATRYGHVELVRILLENDAQVFQRGQKGPSPLHVAAMEGHVPLIDLFSRYVDINIRATCSGDVREQTALHLAAERGLVETVRYMVEKFGAEVNVTDSDHQTALHYVLHRPHDFRRMRKKDDFDLTVDFLIKRGIDFTHVSKNGETALHFAARNQFHRVVELLLRLGADPNVINDRKETPQDVIPQFDMPMKQLFVKYSLGVPASPLMGSIIHPLSPRIVHVSHVNNVSASAAYVQTERGICCTVTQSSNNIQVENQNRTNTGH